MNKPTSDLKPSPWHDGELALQRSVGAVERMVGTGKVQMSRDFMPDQHREFYAQLPFVVLGSVDPHGNPWATLRTGQPGFMQSPIRVGCCWTCPVSPPIPPMPGWRTVTAWACSASSCTPADAIA